MLIYLYNLLKNKKIKSGNVVVAAFGLLILFVVVTSIWAMTIVKPGPLETDYVFHVKKGEGVSIIASHLETGKIISSPFFFKISAKLMFADKNLQAGVYKFEKNISVRDVIKMLARGHTASYKVTIPEGLRTHEILEILKKSPQITGDFEKIDLMEEDLLLPETYMYGHGEGVQNVLDRMKVAMEKALDKAWSMRQDNLPLKNKHELLTLAAMIEKETSVDSERTEVAGVFVNRLRKKMRLQSDPTVIYGLKDYKGDIKRRHLREKHPYNTYVIKGLPKGPIAHPGLASLIAAATPNKTENLYFVADMKGGHVFAKSHAEHNKNVQNYLKSYRKLVQGK